VPLSILSDAFEAMQHAENGDQLRLEMEKFAREMGFERWAYALRITAPSLTPQEFLLHGYPQEWIDRYVARGYFKVDPVVQHCERSTLPVIWDETVLHGDTLDQFWEEARSYGLQAGLSFSVHEQPGVTGIFSLSRDQSLDLDPKELAALVGKAQIFASVLHHAVSRIDLPRLLPQTVANLTQRERECLRWAAEGKTAWETGKILGVSERTAIFHLNNVVQKLGAVNKTQAIVRALALKLL
jgi:DNA-binding CsgD family transcriptional regulator